MTNELAIKQRGDPHPVSCPICGKAWDFGTDYLGRVVAVHSVGRCVPKPAPVYEQEKEPKVIRRQKCAECEKMFVQGPFSRAIICGSECRKVRRDRKHRESEERCRLRWATGWAA